MRRLMSPNGTFRRVAGLSSLAAIGGTAEMPGGRSNVENDPSLLFDRRIFCDAQSTRSRGSRSRRDRRTTVWLLLQLHRRCADPGSRPQPLSHQIQFGLCVRAMNNRRSAFSLLPLRLSDTRRYMAPLHPYKPGLDRQHERAEGSRVGPSPV